MTSLVRLELAEYKINSFWRTVRGSSQPARVPQIGPCFNPGGGSEIIHQVLPYGRNLAELDEPSSFELGNCGPCEPFGVLWGIGPDHEHARYVSTPIGAAPDSIEVRHGGLGVGNCGCD